MELGLFKKKENIGCPGLEEAPLLEKKNTTIQKLKTYPSQIGNPCQKNPSVYP
jgi:hypothetical protein